MDPVLFAVDEDERSLRDVERELVDRYARSYRIVKYYVIRPSQSPDELFHQSVSTFLLEWAHARRVSPHTVHIVSESWTGRGHELKEVLGRCAVPHAFLLADSPDGRALVAESGNGEPLPLVVFPNGTVLANPTNLELASAAGATIDPDRREYDVVIVGGAGQPVSRRRSMAPRRASGRWSSTTAASAARRPRVR